MNTTYFLYAEDDAEDVSILKDVMHAEKQPHHMVCVSDGFALLEYLQSVSKGKAYPSLIILDMHLPRLSGLETLELLRTDDLYRLIPVVIFSSRLSKTDKMACEKLGAEVIAKPENYASWQSILRKLLAYIDE